MCYNALQTKVAGKLMTMQEISFLSEDDRLAAALFLPERTPAPAVIFAHGVFEFKEDFFDYAGRLAEAGFVTLALDMRGHGASEGIRYSCDQEQWTADVISALDYLETRSEVEKNSLGLVGLSSGGTAVLRAAARPDPRAKAIVTLAASFQTNLSVLERAIFVALRAAGVVKRALTGSDLRVNLVSIANTMVTAEDPAVDKHFHTAPQLVDAFEHVPFPSVWNGFVVNIRDELPRVQAPTLVIHGTQDQMEPVSGARVLYETLTCEKELRIIEGSGHLLHLDYGKDDTFAFLLGWLQQHLQA
ncbi:MAG: alpha/beta fold hydrolase [Chloroflexota bacterium]|nr:alpha/beta fold hydrolase [Chloroflexota bacterium]